MGRGGQSSPAAAPSAPDFLAANHVPARWPGDDHAIEDANEYAVIFLENAIFNPTYTFGPNSPYSAAEQSWVRAYWQNTFGAPLGKCGNTNVAQGPGQQRAWGENRAQGYFGGN